MVSAEAEMVHPDDSDAPTVSETKDVVRRPESVLRTEKAVKKKMKSMKSKKNKQSAKNEKVKE